MTPSEPYCDRTVRRRAALRGGRALAFPMFLAAVALGQHPNHGAHPLMPDQKLLVRCQLVESNPPSNVETPLSVNLQSPIDDVDQTVPLPSPSPPMRVRKFLPHAMMEQSVIADAAATAPPALELSIEGPTQSFRRWLIAGDHERNRLISYIGTWRYMAVTTPLERDQLLKEFETEFTRDPKLIVSRVDGSDARELPLTLNSTREAEGLGCKVRVLQFMPDYAMDNAAKAPVNQSDRRRNPAALVELDMEGRVETRWVFSKFPDFSQKDSTLLPYRVLLDCPAQGTADAPDFAVVTVARESHAVWSRIDGKTVSRSFTTADEVPIPGSPYRFRLANFVPQARMVEFFKKDESGKAAPALEIEYPLTDGSTARAWLALGHHRRVVTAAGPAIVSLELRGTRAPAGHP